MEEIKYQQKNIPPIILSFPQLFVTLQVHCDLKATLQDIVG